MHFGDINIIVCILFQDRDTELLDPVIVNRAMCANKLKLSSPKTVQNDHDIAYNYGTASKQIHKDFCYVSMSTQLLPHGSRNEKSAYYKDDTSVGKCASKLRGHLLTLKRLFMVLKED